MARQRKEKDVKIKLKQPDRSGPDPSQQTLLDIAEKRGLLKIPVGEDEEEREGLDENGEPLIGRLGESVLWSISLTMLHFTLDVLVAHQYAVEIKWNAIVNRSAQAFPIILLLIYSLHSHPTPSPLLPTLPTRIQPLVHQLFFFAGSVAAGCYLIYITNVHSYYAVMKQSPPLGCLWIWSVIELNVFWATGSLICCGIFLKFGGYSFL
ncbi:uncharacterized protein LY89DRAFT_270036 [Mollisia scopiformis]|uniref:DUF7719 domain-containing protein n=1 Tax=Mollisia scopiformis TaxID=149040 RepID=A0A132BDP3_MOLSC|nr:uncharacterized protein LY89DRAFT_270036 [Mollisia scopiformis]KUJ10109.1 hypothetical protein LY89DRAFT_270036 [Mollisia scopiformis]